MLRMGLHVNCVFLATCEVGESSRQFAACSLLPQDVWTELNWHNHSWALWLLYELCSDSFKLIPEFPCSHVHACKWFMITRNMVHIAKHMYVLHSKFLCNLIIRFHNWEAEKAHLHWFWEAIQSFQNMACFQHYPCNWIAWNTPNFFSHCLQMKLFWLPGFGVCR